MSVSTSELPGTLSESADVLAKRETLRTISLLTGGQYYAPGQTTQAAIGEVLKVASSSYTLGFRPDSHESGKTPHRVKVTAAASEKLVATGGIPGVSARWPEDPDGGRGSQFV